MYYLNIFFIFSIFGHFIENFFYHSKDSGVLYGYWTPIYGFGVIIIITIGNILAKRKLKTKAYILSLFFSCAFILSLMELIGGYLIELILHKAFWDYSNMPLNIGKYTAIPMAFIWGISSIIFLYLIKPLIELPVKKIPRYITYILSILFLTDIILTLFKSFS